MDDIVKERMFELKEHLKIVGEEQKALKDRKRSLKKVYPYLDIRARSEMKRVMDDLIEKITDNRDYISGKFVELDKLRGTSHHELRKDGKEHTYQFYVGRIKKYILFWNDHTQTLVVQHINNISLNKLNRRDISTVLVFANEKEAIKAKDEFESKILKLEDWGKLKSLKSEYEHKRSEASREIAALENKIRKIENEMKYQRQNYERKILEQKDVVNNEVLKLIRSGGE